MEKINIETISLITRKKLRQACLQNAKDFLKHAKKQFKSQNFNLATFFAITSYEECLKVGLLNSFEQKTITAKQFDMFWGSHTSKLLSDHAIIKFSEIKDEKIQQEYALPNLSSHISG